MRIFLSHRPSASPSFALISVLALVSLAALTATAFLAAARLDSRANMSLLNSTRLEMALHAGATSAQEMLDYAPSKQFNFVTTYWRGTGPNDWTNELGYLLNGAVVSASTTGNTNTLLNFYACFSTANFTNLSNNASALVIVSNAATSQGTFTKDMTSFMQAMTNFAPGKSTTIPLLGGQTSPPVGWVYIRQDVRTKAGSTNTASVPVVRFAFYVQDLGGLIDVQRMGATNARSTGTNPEEVCLTNAVGTSLTSAALASNLIASNNRWKYLSPGLLANSNAGGLTTNDLRYVTTGLLQWSNAWSRIPVGLGYKNSTQAKVNLNATNTVQFLAFTLTSNLANFSARGGGMSGGAYVSNVAANIMDYLDADSDPTVDTSSTMPAWRGVEPIAWPNEFFTRFHFETADTKAVAGGFQYVFKYKSYLEVWNISQTNVPLTPLILSNNRSFQVRIPPLPPFNLSNSLFGAVTNQTLTPVAGSPTSLKPGEFGMLETPTINLSYTAPGSTAATNVSFLDWNGNSTVILTTNNKVISATKAGQLIYNKDITATALYGVSQGVVFPSAFGYACQSTYRAGPPNLKSVGGDPRAQLFLGTWPTKGQPYVNYASPGGLNWEQGNNFPNAYVNAQLLWPDGGVYRPTDLGANPATYGTDPGDLYNTKKGKWSTNVALSKINNTGVLTNLCELGNIFDPIQWEDSSQLPSSAGGMPGLWTNLSAAATPVVTAGGRTSLRVGRWEFTRFAFTNQGSGAVSAPNMMISSAALLDVFCLTNQYDEGGRINLNTAPAPVLRALAGGCRVTQDPALAGVGGSGTNFPVPPSMAEAFAQGVMRFRAQYPFYSASQLAFIGTDPTWPNTNTWPANAVFGNTNSISLSTAPGNAYTTARINITQCNDAAAEEWFSKVYGLATTQSRNFRCYVVAQLVDTNGNGTGPVVRKYYQILNRNNTDAQTDTPANISSSTYNVYESSY